ncbi:MAG: Pyrroline-5-carboxylate reductase [Firmicutes bacterium]|nr:Pyrroline-5-carboxylate reductase [Bacillota bacterium]
MLEIPPIGVIGVGRAGTALCAGLVRAKLPLAAIASRRRERADDLARALHHTYGCTAQVVEARDVSAIADTIFLAAPDGAIADAVRAMTWRKGKLAVHLSGAATLELLSPAAQSGASVASFHPLNTFPAVSWDDAGLSSAVATLGNSFVAIAASDTPAEQMLMHLAPLLCRGYFTVPECDRALYHVAAVFASNFVTGLVSASLELWQSMGYSEQEALRFMAPLLTNACTNTLRLGPRQALTGPAARGDVGTIAKHVAALAQLSPQGASSRELYSALTLCLLPLARDAGTLNPAAAAQIRQLITKEHEPCEK